LQFIPQKMLHALRASSNNLTRLGIRHVICGGVAVGAYGYIRATRDVAFLVGDECFVTAPGGLVSFAPGVTWAVDGIPTDVIPLETPAKPEQNMRFLERDLEHPYDLDGMPLISPEALITMKLIAHRRKDLDDVANIIANGAAKESTVRIFLRLNQRSDLLPQLTRALSET
jgi:hypothetical protein